jgi:hypothetical protein
VVGPVTPVARPHQPFLGHLALARSVNSFNSWADA